MKAASVYGRIGLRVVPIHSAIAGVCSCSKGSACPSAGKHPRLSNWEIDATADAEQIAEWQARFPSGNIGLATGGEFFALDVDPKNGGPETLAKLVAVHGDLPETVQQQTGSGGAHYLFQPVSGIANSAGKLGRGLDTRGEGGQIVVAPSISAQGPYTWINPPWSTPLAPAPEWLLELLQRRAEPEAPPTATTPTVFPPASESVCLAAGDALEAHGPAVEGQGGDLHTWRAAALLANDFALTEDEAWPLLVEWNATCTPPWGESELAEKLRGGAKYAGRQFGCRRHLEALEAARALIAAWQNDPARTERGMLAMIPAVRPFFALLDPVQHQILLRELVSATGLKQRALSLPEPSTEVHFEVPAGAIQVTPEIHKAADDAVKAIAPHVFVRNGVICEIVKATERTFIHDLEPARIVDLMSRSAKWVRSDGEALVAIAPPAPVAAILHARRNHSGLRCLEAVTTSPVFLADGTILQERGYSPQARVFLEPSVVVDVPEEPTREDARTAIRLFKSLLSDFRFVGKGDFGSWLAGVLSSLVKPATGNAPGPLICVSASSPGAGKSLLTGIASRIIAGVAPEIRPYNPKDAGEWGKRVTAFVRAATPISVFDNINGPFGDETIDRLITSSTWSDRVLGASDAPPIAVVTTWWATGNNIEPQGDTVRRVLMCQLEVDTEKPQERTGFAIKNILKHTEENRAELLSAALTILRAYHVAGRPDQDLPAWGSFEVWSDLVRGALVWCGLTDPFTTQQRAAAELNEPETEAHDFWLNVIESSDGAPSSIAVSANARGASEVLGVRESLTPYTVKKFVKRFVNKPRAGKRIRRDGPRLIVERIQHAS